jgi:hypothetical protein
VVDVFGLPVKQAQFGQHGEHLLEVESPLLLSLPVGPPLLASPVSPPLPPHESICTWPGGHVVVAAAAVGASQKGTGVERPSQFAVLSVSHEQ